MKRMLKPETIKKRTDYTFRRIEAKLIGYNVRYADEFIGALKNVDIAPSRETLVKLLHVISKMIQ